jgi:hypothetical protein
MEHEHLYHQHDVERARSQAANERVNTPAIAHCVICGEPVDLAAEYRRRPR